MARKTETADQPLAPQLDEDQVVAYLSQHADLLLRRPELLTRLLPPSRFGEEPVVDLQLLKIRRLTQELDQMKGCAEHLITTSRSNMSIQSRTHNVVLALLAAGDVEKLLRVVVEDIPGQLDLDVALLAFEDQPDDEPLGKEWPGDLLPYGMTALPKGSIKRVIGAADVMLRAECPADPVVFGNAVTLINSFALARVMPEGRPAGLLALGSRHERTFHSSQGTELLSFLAHVIEDCLSRWWCAE